MDEIVIKVEGEEPATPPTPPVVIVTDEAPAAPTGDVLGAALAVMSLESLASENAELRSRIEGLESGRDYIHERINGLEVAQVIEEVADVVADETAAVAADGLVTEIPAPILPEDSVKPKERKRRFV